MHITKWYLLDNNITSKIKLDSLFKKYGSMDPEKSVFKSPPVVVIAVIWTLNRREIGWRVKLQLLTQLYEYATVHWL